MRSKFPVTVHLIFLRADRVLLLRRFNTGYRDGEYSLPAGHLDGGETVVAAAIREAREEIDVRIHEQEVHFSSVMHRREDDERVDFFVEIRAWEGEPVNNEPNKCDELRWAAIDSLPQNTIPYIRRGIDNHFKAARFDEFGW